MTCDLCGAEIPNPRLNGINCNADMIPKVGTYHRCDACTHSITHSVEPMGDAQILARLRARGWRSVNEKIVDACDPGIRRVVRWLMSLDFRTCDSGDGVTKLRGRTGREEDGVLEYPHVFIQTGTTENDRGLEYETRRLQKLLQENGIEVLPVGAIDKHGSDRPCCWIQATYDPMTMGIIELAWLDDHALPKGLGEEAPMAEKQPQYGPRPESYWENLVEVRLESMRLTRGCTPKSVRDSLGYALRESYNDGVLRALELVRVQLPTFVRKETGVEEKIKRLIAKHQAQEESQ